MSSRYLDEIMEQPDALHRAVANYAANQPDLGRVAQAIRSNQYRQVVLTGMGISYHG